MKRILTIVISLLLCLALIACGAEKNTEHEYILSLLEAGDYDMAILVIEGIRERELGPRLAETTPAEPEITLTGVPTAPNVSKTVSLAIETIRSFMDETGNAMVKGYEEVCATTARPVTVTHAMEYRLGNCDGKGNDAHCLLIYLSMDIVQGDGLNDNLQLLLDLDTHKLYHSAELDWSLIEACGGMPTNKEEFTAIALNSYHTYKTYGNDILMADMEFCEEFSDADLAAVNEAIK